MSGPFIFIATNRLREGKLAAEHERARELSSFIEANEPQLLAFNEYVNEEGTEVGVVQMHPDAASMQRHMDAVAERAARAYAETLEATTSIQVYGEPSDAVLEILSRQAGAGVPMSLKRHHIAGFTRVQ
jgi:NAD-dependent oxidoreductase involved in siderophore biosynthesis